MAGALYPAPAEGILLAQSVLLREFPLTRAGIAKDVPVEAGLSWEALPLKEQEDIGTLVGFLSCQEAGLEFPGQ